jgi:hypothetical protein
MHCVRRKEQISSKLQKTQFLNYLLHLLLKMTSYRAGTYFNTKLRASHVILSPSTKYLRVEGTDMHMHIRGV